MTRLIRRVSRFLSVFLVLSFVGANVAFAEEMPSVKYGLTEQYAIQTDDMYARCLKNPTNTIETCRYAAEQVVADFKSGKIECQWSGRACRPIRHAFRSYEAEYYRLKQSNDQLSDTPVKVKEVKVAAPAGPVRPSGQMQGKVFDHCMANRTAKTHYDCVCVAETGVKNADTILQSEGQSKVDRAKLNLARAESPAYRQSDEKIAQLREVLNSKQAALENKDYDSLDVNVSVAKLYSLGLESGQCKSRENTYNYQFEKCEKYNTSGDKDCECHANAFADLWLESEIKSMRSKYQTSFAVQANRKCQ